MPLLYSYIRWSSDRQAKGTTLQRQMASAKEFALTNGLQLVEITDPGVSAFRGKNTKTGNLGNFIDAVREGIIPDDSWLYVENLDRLTRQEVTTAQKLFIDLLELGLTLVTGMDKRVYTLESVNQNPTDLMISILMFSRANEESKTKQSRTLANVEILVERHKQGLPVNIKSCGKHPFWIDDTGSQYEAVRQHPEYWIIAREAIDQFLLGYGIYKVKRYLDEKYPNGLNGKEWDYQVLKRMRENRALIGERTIKVGNREHKLIGYYPSLCTDEVEFLKLQELKQQNGYKSKKDKPSDNINLLSGLTLMRCSKCSGTMTGFLNRGKPRYICLNGRHLQKGCVGWSVTAPLVDQCVITAVLMGYIDSSRREGQDTTELTNLIERKSNDVDAINGSIGNISIAIEKGANIDQLVERIKILSSDREILIKEIDKLKTRKAMVESKGSFEFTIMEFMNLIQWGVFIDVANESRNKIRTTINNIIDYVIIDKTDGCITIKVKCLGSDEVFVFGGYNRKPQWKFDIEQHFDEVLELIVTDTTENERLLDAGRMYEKVKDSYKEYHKTVVGMMAVVGYPELDGKAFWPNR
ncbi:recombinase family protein [Buttiauxella sp. A2-C2_NF]|uniref:recombinase family protein n=1 Tax=Buttiauxella ferragutiae TaxID=82989 RepID=UPI001E316FD9|nr:recombinase family protein [Buttiauxella ferragutiae]MCE0826581.1 recombinase family protein [Buttiauxella ferragutiae]